VTLGAAGLGRLRIERGERFSFRANQGHVEVAFARTVEFDEEDGLPGAEDEFAIEDGDRERRTKNGGRHVRPCVRGIVTMPKVDLGNHLLNDIQQIFLRSLPDFPGRQARRRMGHEKTAEPFCHQAVGNQFIDLIREVDHLFEPISLNF